MTAMDASTDDGEDDDSDLGGMMRNNESTN